MAVHENQSAAPEERQDIDDSTIFTEMLKELHRIRMQLEILTDTKINLMDIES